MRAPTGIGKRSEIPHHGGLPTQREALMVQIAILVGSARPHANSAKAMNIIKNILDRWPDVSVDVIDPRDMELPVPGPKSQEAKVQEVSQSLQARLRNTSGVIMMTPEYDGTISAVMKLLVEYLGYPSVLAGKPVMLVGVAGGRIGAHRALEHLRSIATHIGCHVLPDMVSVGSAYSVFGQNGDCLDPVTEQALQEAAASLVSYVRARLS